jgi:hypothetical protein
MTGVSFRSLSKGGMREKADVRKFKVSVSRVCGERFKGDPADSMPVEARGIAKFNQQDFRRKL